MADMEKACVDDFGIYLARLRAKRNLSPQDLGRLVGKSHDYIGGWERYRRRINKGILLKVMDALLLPKPERDELTRLAIRRELPDPSKQFYDAYGDYCSSLLFPLMSMPYDWPDDVVGNIDGRTHLIDAISWVLACFAAMRLKVLDPFREVRWPTNLVNYNVVPEVPPSNAKEDATSQERSYPVLRGKLKLREMPCESELWFSRPLDVALMSDWMARAYRSMLLRDLTPTEAVASHLHSWAYHTDGRNEFLSLRFREAEHENSFGLDNVSLWVLEDFGRRSLAYHLWTAHPTPDPSRGRFAWECQITPTDWRVIWTAARAGMEARPSPDQAQELRDAIAIMRAPYWEAVLQHVRTTRHLELAAETDLEAALLERRLDEGLRTRVLADPWQLATIDREILVRFLQSTLLMEARACSIASQTAREKTATPDHEQSKPSAKRVKGGKPPRQPRKKGKTRK